MIAILAISQKFKKLKTKIKILVQILSQSKVPSLPHG
jgi:hypothetical protein